MYEDPSYPPYYPPQRQTAKTSFWRKLGGGSLSISIIVHAILLAIGVVWIFQIIPAQRKEEVDFMPKSGGGGASAASQTTQKKRATMTTMPNAPRLAAKGSSSTFTLPDVDAGASMASVGSLSSGALSGGLGGSGSGGGRGTGNGIGFGSGTAPGLSNGTGANSPFGLPQDLTGSALIGTFYDFKQTRSHKSTEIYPDQLPAIIKEFTDDKWRESSLSKYYRAPQKLYQTKLYIPTMPAGEGPKAFNCENEVKPSRWMVVYRGVVTPPKSGKYRFVGLGDDCMVIRFNNQHVFDYGWTSGTTGIQLSKNLSVLKGTKENPEIQSKLKKDYPMPLPMTFYQYPGIPKWNDLICGLAVGAEFEAKVGTSYPIEILISEIPGGSFGAMLLIEEVGATYKKTANGSPILPLFRTDNSVPADTSAVPLDPTGMPWKVTSKAKTDI
ncbi:hypothetical protein [Luteolibacter sp. LG18]|uniref:hypothetical protein n=1 Tax=Luteolibacter sp. LG18 TaxID=2819286 RepID=UPI002B289EBF|nr:hypothetical protein llg_34800 [Luteolibacter sp. LG18]